MGLFSSIGKIFKSVARSVVKFAKSPIGQMLLGVGLTACTGGVGGILAGLGSRFLVGAGGRLLSGLGGGLLRSLGGGQLQGLIGGLAQKFLPQAVDLLSGRGAGVMGNLFKGLNGGDSGAILDVVKGFAGSIFRGSPETQEVAQHNTIEMAAFTRARQLIASR